MNTETFDLNKIIFILPFALVFWYLLVRVIKYGGFKGGLFGAKVESTVGEVSGITQMWFTKAAMKIDVLKNDDWTKDIGIGIVQKSFLSYKMTWISFKKSDVKKMIALLQDAYDKL